VPLRKRQAAQSLALPPHRRLGKVGVDLILVAPALAVGKREVAHTARRLLPRRLLVRSASLCQHPLVALSGNRPLKAVLVRGYLDHGGRRPRARAPRRARRVLVFDLESASTNKTQTPVRPPLHCATIKRGITLQDPLPAPARLRRGPDSPRARATVGACRHVTANALGPLSPGADATQAPLQLGLRDGRSARAVGWAGRVRGGVVVRARPGRQGQNGRSAACGITAAPAGLAEALAPTSRAEPQAAATVWELVSACGRAGDDAPAALGPGGGDSGARTRGGVGGGVVRKGGGVEAIAAARLEFGKSRNVFLALRIR